MARRRVAKKRQVNPDPKYNKVLVTKFINRMMLDGKKGVAEKIFYDALKIIHDKTNKDGLEVFQDAIDKVKPQVEVRSRRVGGATYQVPVEVRPERQVTLALRWMVNYSRNRNEKGMSYKLAGEIIDASKESGESIKKRDDLFKMAESNKAFAHYKW